MKSQDVSMLVTGGGSGLGAATCREFAALGAKVNAVDLGFRDEVHSGVTVHVGDVCSEADLSGVINKIVQHSGKLDVLVCCAGVAPAQRVLGKNGPQDLESFRQVIDINLNGMFNAVRLAADEMSRNQPNESGERGVIIMTASVAAFEGQIGQVAYAASKGAVASMTLPLAREFSRYGIRVCTIAPGIFETPMLLKMPQEVRDSLGAMVPFPSRLGRPSEFAALCRHIVENEMLNGEVIRLDGAIRMAAK